MKTVFQVNLVGVAPPPGFSRHARWVFEDLPEKERPGHGDELNWNGLYPGWELPVVRRRKFVYIDGRANELLIEFQSNQPHLIQHLLDKGWHTEILSDPAR